MPRNITVTFADGSSHVYQNAPDDLTPESVEERATAEFGKPVKSLDGGRVKPPGEALAEIPGMVKRAVVSAGVGAAKTAQDIPRALGILRPDLQQLIPGMDDTLAQQGRSGQEFYNAIGDKSGVQNPWGRAAAEGAGGAVLGGPGAPARMAVSGAAAGLGSEAGARIGGQDNLLARILGGLAGGVAGASAANRLSQARPQTSTLAREGLEGIPPAALAKAEELMRRAKAQNIDMDLAQALEGVGVPAGNLTTLRNVLAGSKHGENVQRGLREQPEHLANLADTTAANIPGPMWSKNDAANAVGKAATDTVDAAKRARSAAVRPDYEAAGDLSQGFRRNFMNVLSEKLQQPGLTESTVEAIHKAMVKVRENKATGVPTTHALDFDTIISDMVGGYKGSPLTPPDPRTVGQLKGLAGELNKLLQSGAPEVAAAERKFKAISDSVVNPLKQGPTGQMAGPRGANDYTQVSAAKIEALFARGSDPQIAEGRRDIPRLAAELKTIDKEALPAAIKAFIRGRLDTAFESSPGGGAMTAPESAARLWDSLFKTRAQWQGMRDMAAAAARSMDVPEVEVVRGLENLAQITKALKNRPGNVSGLSKQEAFQMGGQSYGADALRVFGFLPFEKAARRLEDVTMARTFRELDQLLTTPEGIDTLRKLSKVPVMSNKSVVILGSMFGTDAAVDQ